MVIYRPLKKYPWYLVGSDGSVLNSRTGHVMKGMIKKTGYVEIALTDEEHKQHFALLHRIVAEAFCEKTTADSEVNHKNGDKLDNRAVNLEWISHGENLKHAYENGLRDDDVSPRPVIATNMDTGEQMTFPSIYKAARFFNISQGNICMCCKGKRPYAGGYYWEYAA